MVLRQIHSGVTTYGELGFDLCWMLGGIYIDRIYHIFNQKWKYYIKAGTRQRCTTKSQPIRILIVEEGNVPLQNNWPIGSHRELMRTCFLSHHLLENAHFQTKYLSYGWFRKQDDICFINFSMNILQFHTHHE